MFAILIHSVPYIAITLFIYSNFHAKHKCAAFCKLLSSHKINNLVSAKHECQMIDLGSTQACECDVALEWYRT